MSSDIGLLRRMLPLLSEQSFIAFIAEFMGRDAAFEPLEEIGDGSFYQPLLDSYGDSLHSVFLTHYFPLELFKEPDRVDIADPILRSTLKRLRKAYEGRVGWFGMVSPELQEAATLQSLAFITNFSGLSEQEYRAGVIPKYRKLMSEEGIDASLFVGSYDSFLDLQPGDTAAAFARFVMNNQEGLSIQLGESVSVQGYSSQKVLLGGVLPNSRTPIEPVTLLKPSNRDEIVLEFERLLNLRVKESVLEDFLTKYYQDIFGPKYDRIETQLWLRFPDLDIAGENRRLDIFLRNRLEQDWELFEVKRAIELTGTYRDVPVFASEVMHAMQQLRNYERILAQDRVRQKLAVDGIEYFEPSLNLVVGRRPQIPVRQWRWLKATQEKGLKIITFDDLLDELRLRLQDRTKLEDNIQ